jgi:metallo-beta-lactamase family protein
MALRVLDVYRDAAAAGDVDVRTDDGVLDLVADLHECHTPEESKALSELTYPSIIVSASGMATGGRVLHHLRRLLPGAENLVILSGFQADGTRGRTLVDGARSVKMHGRYVPVRAQVLAMESLSVHADGDELVEWLGAMASPPGTVYIVHGESSASTALAERVEQELGVLAVVPRDGERVVLA